MKTGARSLVGAVSLLALAGDQVPAYDASGPFLRDRLES
jgi:hypothetical protein